MTAAALQRLALETQPKTSPRSSSASGPPSEPPWDRSQRLSAVGRSWSSFATYCRSRSAAIKLRRSSIDCSTCTTSSVGSGGRDET